MIPKIIQPDSFDFGMPAAAFIDTFSKGFHKEALEKRAAQFDGSLEDFERKPGHSYIHLITTGALETYGCFTAGNIFVTAKGEIKDVSCMEEGDPVVAHDQSLQRLHAVVKKSFTGSFATIQARCIPPIECTADHKFRVMRRKDITCVRDRHHRCTPKTCGNSQMCFRGNGCSVQQFTPILKWVAAKDLRKGDFLVVPRGKAKKEDSRPIDPYHIDLGRLFGLFLAEGSFTKDKGKRRGASFSFHAEETSYMNYIKEVADAMGITTTICSRAGGRPNEATLVLNGSFIASMIHEACGEYSHEKRISARVFNQRDDFIKQLIGGYIDGDGHASDVTGQLTICSCSKTLLLQMKQLLFRLGIPSSWMWNDNPKQHDDKRKSPYGQIAMSYHDAYPVLRDYSEKVAKWGYVPKQGPDSKTFCTDDHVYLPVKSVSLEHGVTKEVYDANVKGPHSYVVNFVSVHNSNNNGDAFPKEAYTMRPFLHPEKSLQMGGGLKEYHDKTFMEFGKLYRNHQNRHKGGTPSGYIVKAAYNDEMNRGELIVGMETDKWSKELEKVANEKPIYFSMACFTEDAMVAMFDGSTRSIKEITPGDTVVTHERHAGIVSSVRKIEYVLTRSAIVTFEGVDPLTCTPEHPFHVRYGEGGVTRWEPAEKLEKGMRVTAPFTEKGYVEVLSVHFDEGPLTVYNMEVGHEDHSYLVNGVAVHNCDVPADVCSACGNQATTLAAYCDHLKNDMLAITKEGHQVYAINDKPLFHDISGVFKPADKIAFALRKVASGHILSSAELASLHGMAPRLDIMRKYAGAPQTKRIDLLRKLAAIEKEILASSADSPEQDLVLPFKGCGGRPEEFDETVVNRLKGEDPGALFGSMKGKMVMMPFETFLKIVTGDGFGQVEPHVSAAKKALPGVFGRLLASPDLESCLKDGSFDSDGSVGGLDLESEISRLIGSHSLAAEPVKRRVIRITISGAPGSNVEMPKEASDIHDAAADFLAKEYARYVVAFADGLPESKLGLTVGQTIANSI